MSQVCRSWMCSGFVGNHECFISEAATRKPIEGKQQWSKKKKPVIKLHQVRQPEAYYDYCDDYCIENEIMNQEKKG